MKRSGIFERDEYRCVYCGTQFDASELTLDHVHARVKGGDRSEGNLVTACGACNTLKGHRRLSVFLHENASARENFRRYAVHVWPRLMRLLNEELAELDAKKP
ncbi:MAG TPA: HNH endonuclease [Gemmatimonadaceae bacterium]|nr:HNH endonuclease [Gemmatimonadaceae bacterium]